jgi:hypothetical protein
VLATSVTPLSIPKHLAYELNCYKVGLCQRLLYIDRLSEVIDERCAT